MSDLMQDILAGRIGYREANAVCAAGGKMLRVIELTHKYGRKAGDPASDSEPVLDLAAAPKQIN